LYGWSVGAEEQPKQGEGIHSIISSQNCLISVLVYIQVILVDFVWLTGDTIQTKKD